MSPEISQGERLLLAANVLFYIFLLALLAMPAFGQGSEIKTTGEYTASAGDTAETASRLAVLDARRKAVEQTAIQLTALPAVMGMRLGADTIRAFAFGLADVETQPARDGATNSQSVYRGAASSRFDAASALTRLRVLWRDVEVTSEMLRLSQEQNRDWDRLAGLPAAERANAAQRLEARQLVARAAALAVADRGFMTLNQEILDSRSRAKKLAEAALAIDPANAAARYRLSDLLLLENNPAAAEKELRALIAANPDFAAAHNKLGDVLAEEEKYPEAVAEFRETLRLDAKYVSAHVDLGSAFKSQGQLDEAIAAFREGIRVDANFVDAHNNLGIALANKERFAEAGVAFREVIRLDPESALGHYNLALALAADEKEADAIMELREAVRLNPGHYNAQYQLGERLRLQGELADSVKAFNEFLRIAPETPDMQRKRDRAVTFVEAFDEP